LRTNHKKLKEIVVFSSGAGSNAEKIISYFKKVSDVCISVVYTNNPEAGVLKKAKNHGVKTRVFSAQEYQKEVLKELLSINPAIIVLAGFLWKIPKNYIDNFPNKIINIHPSLLPKYGGNGMYGKNVFKEIFKNKEELTGITIHYIDEKFDTGPIIFQAQVKLLPNDDVTEIANKTRQLEHKFFSAQIHKLIR